jgi:hypothetical protein
LNTYWGVSFEPSQLNYQAGFHALIAHRAHLLAPQYIEKISDFHRGILDTTPRAKQQTSQSLSGKHQGVILKQTNETSKKLGYTTPSTAIKLTFWDTLSWTLYRILALLFRPYLWRAYRLLPLKLKRIIRRRNKEYAP